MTTSRTTGIGVAAVGALLLANGAWYAPLMFSAGAEAKLSEYGGEPPFQIFYVVHLLALTALAVLLPRLSQVRGATGRSLPRWLPTTLLIVTVLQIATVYTQAFVVPYLAGIAPQALDDETIDTFALSMMAIWVAFLLGFVTLAVAGVTRQVLPIPAAVLVGLGAASMPMLGPAGSMLIGAGLLYWAVRRMLQVAPAPGREGSVLPAAASSA